VDLIRIDDFNVAIDPETNFWSIFDEEDMPEEVFDLFDRIRDRLLEKMKKYRFEVEFKTVYLNPTEKCNACCPYCYIPPETRGRGMEMDYKTLRDILERVETLSVENVIFHGAEPLTVRDLIFKAMNEFDYNFGIQTNGFLLTEEDADFLIDRDVNVGLSFDSHHREIEDLLRGNGHYEKITSLLDIFDGYRRLNVITTINKLNYEHLPGIVDFLAGKIEAVLMNPVRGTSRGGRELRPDPVKSSKYFIEAVNRAINHTKDGNRIVIGDFANIMLGIVAPYSRVLQCDISPCGAGRRFVSICPDGVYPCGEFIGMNEFRVPLSEIENLYSHFDSVRNRTVERIGECRDCTFRNMCGNPCPAEIYSEHGTMFEKSYYCEFYKNMIEHAFRVIRRGDTESVIRLKSLKKMYELTV